MQEGFQFLRKLTPVHAIDLIRPNPHSLIASPFTHCLCLLPAVKLFAQHA